MTTSQAPAAAHDQHQRWGQRVRTVCAVVLAVCVGGWTLSYLGRIVTPLLVALFLFFMIKPLAEAVVRWRVPQWLAYPFLLLLAVLLIQVFGSIVLANVAAFEERLPFYKDRLLKLMDAYARLTGYSNEAGQFDWDKHSLGELFAGSWQQFLHAVFGPTLGFVEFMLLVLFYLFFLFLEAQFARPSPPRRPSSGSASPRTSRRASAVTWGSRRASASDWA
jgi:predicted PurR-regulated permease PerM